MKILLCHAYYQQRGGEDQSFEDEARLLESRGHDVVRYTRHNDELNAVSRWSAAATAFWNRTAYHDILRLIRRHRPDVMHCTNTFPLLSPAIYYAASAEKVPVVQSLRNYRQLCPGALLMRDGQVCEDCLGKSFAWSSVRHACYRGSRLASAVVMGMNAFHKLRGTWSQAVDLYFTLTEFARQRFIAGGWCGERIRVKPNFVDPDPGVGEGAGGYAVFVGRLSPEKGIHTLLTAWERLSPQVPLKIVGDGPLADDVKAYAATHPSVEHLGHRPHSEVLEIVRNAACLVMPSLWYETFGRTIIEAYAAGTPVIVSDLGAMAELVEAGITGFKFRPGDADQLAQCVSRLLEDSSRRESMRRTARSRYEQRYTADLNYRLLIDIYTDAIEQHRRRRNRPLQAAAL